MCGCDGRLAEDRASLRGCEEDVHGDSVSDKVAMENQGFKEEQHAERENSLHIGSTLCGRQSVSVAVDAFGVCSDLVLLIRRKRRP